MFRDFSRFSPSPFVKPANYKTTYPQVCIYLMNSTWICKYSHVWQLEVASAFRVQR